MIRTLDLSMLNIPYPVREIAPLAARHGIEAISATADLFDDAALARETDALMKDNGLKWGLLPMTADYYYWDLTDEAFDDALKRLAQRAAVAEKLGVTHAYNHVWPASFREFDENFEWHVRRVKAVTEVLNDHGVQYGLEFLGPHELRTWQKHEFVHSLAGVLAIADATGGKAGVAFDSFHWYCSGNGCPDDLLYMAQHTDRLVALHLNDAVAGVPFDKQQDMQRRLPMETGVIDTRDILCRFKAAENDSLYMIEPFEPGRTNFHAMTAEDAVRAAAAAFAAIE